ncbi:MAG: tryptophan synthase subunit beta [bacterium]|nr:tryptophan synthase subunit beta [bacterium]
MISTIDFKKPDSLGFYGGFGGAFVPELLRQNLTSLEEAFREAKQDDAFHSSFQRLLKDYVGRPSPLYFSNYLSETYGAKIYLKREDLNHTGSHKINNALGQILLAQRMQKRQIIAETGAGQHGVATATACALLNMECIVFMGEKDMERQAPNVQRMRMLGAKVIAATSGSKTLKDATNEAIRYWINHPDAYYLIGSVVGPHPYPEMVAYFQSVISHEIQTQLLAAEGTETPSKVIACVGGGSNAAGAFHHFYDSSAQLIAVEAAGMGVDTGQSAATSALGVNGVLHGSMTLLMQDDDGQVVEPYSISAGLDYPGIGPEHAHAILSQRTKAINITDTEAVAAAFELTRNEGIIPALESAHAIAALKKTKFQPDEIVVVNLSGRGDKDMSTYIKHHESIS